MSSAWLTAVLISTHPNQSSDLPSHCIGWPDQGQPALFVYIASEMRSVSRGLAPQRVLNGAGTHYTALMSIFHEGGCAEVFPSPDKIASPVNVTVFVMGLMWCGWHSQAKSIQRASFLHLQPCSNITERKQRGQEWEYYTQTH